MNGLGNDSPSSHSASLVQVGEKKRQKNYKLLVDPAIKKGCPKLYRYDGLVAGDPLYPPVQVRDPRSALSRIWSRYETVDLPVPRFKIDANYVGIPPPLEVTITNLNDNIHKNFLEDMLKKFGILDEVTIYFHPRTRKHLGLARIVFQSVNSAKICVEKLNQTSVMGNIINVFIDTFGYECKRLFEELIADKPPSATFNQQPFPGFDEKSRNIPPPTIDPRRRSGSQDSYTGSTSSSKSHSMKEPYSDYRQEFTPHSEYSYSDSGSSYKGHRNNIGTHHRQPHLPAQDYNYSSQSTPHSVDSGYSYGQGRYSSSSSSSLHNATPAYPPPPASNYQSQYPPTWNSVVRRS